MFTRYTTDNSKHSLKAISSCDNPLLNSHGNQSGNLKNKNHVCLISMHSPADHSIQGSKTMGYLFCVE